jgi:tRNA (adenine57-N1/adenine58-N1)-methyltransferase
MYNVAISKDCSFLTKEKIGKKIRKGKNIFIVVKPNILDILGEIRRMPQVVLPKDVSLIIAYTGASPGWQCLDAGTGSGYMAIFLSNIVKPGKVISYEKRGEFAENIKKQVMKLGIKNLEIIHGDILKSKIKEKFDLITLDMKYAEKAVKKLDKNLNVGGFFAIYSPHIEQVKLVREVLEKLNYTKIITIENIVREWKVTNDYTHPVPSGILHTGFITIARKFK